MHHHQRSWEKSNRTRILQYIYFSLSQGRHTIASISMATITISTRGQHPSGWGPILKPSNACVELVSTPERPASRSAKVVSTRRMSSSKQQITRRSVLRRLSIEQLPLLLLTSTPSTCNQVAATGLRRDTMPRTGSITKDLGSLA